MWWCECLSSAHSPGYLLQFLFRKVFGCGDLMERRKEGPSVNEFELDERLLALLPDDQDLPYEEELLRNPYNVKLWLRYIAARKDAPAKRRNVLYERALRALPGSYKVL
jgi:hypothetical protein